MNYPNQKIKSIYVVTQQGASGYAVGRVGVTEIKIQPMGLGDPHYVIYKGDEVAAMIRYNAPVDVTFEVIG